MKQHHIPLHYPSQANIEFWDKRDITNVEYLHVENSLETIDAIIANFFDQYDINDLLKNVTKFVGGIHVNYSFQDQTFVAQLCDERYGYPDIKSQLVIKLFYDRSNRYLRYSNELFIESRNKNDMRDIPQSIYYNMKVNAEKITKLASLQKYLNCTIKFTYHYTAKRIDIEFRNDIGAIPLKITFEHGNPIEIDKEEYYIDLNAVKEL